MSKNGVISVFLADDDPDDRMFFEDAISEIEVKIELKTASNGDELIDLLKNSINSKPDIIFLDLNMPIKNGVECLQEIRTNKDFANTFISIYSTSLNGKEIEQTFKKGANLYLRKPGSFTELKSLLKKVFELNRGKYFPPGKDEFVLTA